MFPTIMIIDDEPNILQSLSGLLMDEGFEVMTASNGYEGLKLIEEEVPDLVLLDIWMPGIDGIETLKEIKQKNPSVPVIIITGHGNIETAVKATKIGAFNLIEKPLSIDKVIVDINNALNFRRLQEENQYLRKKTIEKHAINGRSPAILDMKKQIAVVAPTQSWILISGENGSGKELAARNIHQFSQRAEAPFMDINCAAIPEDRLESELFGHEKGAVDWAENRKKGRLEMAEGGTLFLDEIGDMGLSAQAKLLRVLQEQTFQRVGGGRKIHVDVRIIAATNKNLEAEIEAGHFRADLYHRLNEIPMHVPALRNRKEDIPDLVNIFIRDLALRYGVAPKAMPPETLELLSSYDWPGNVRELKNLIGRLVLMTEGDDIMPENIPSPYNPSIDSVCEPELSLFSVDTITEAVGKFEQLYIRKKLEQYGGDTEKTAKSIGIAPERIQEILSAEEGRV
jgi:two-component system nitrogen regulation response regulator NtrX